ncbi:MAG: hypothetical protein KDD62_00250 [Bdellovibrionales bacterium]|nr:hypothetical protein [Bdellovibrionales bacterium]
MDSLQKKLERAEKKVEILEQMIEEKTRELYFEQQKLMRSKTFLEKILNTVNASILVTNSEYIVVLSNAAADKILGNDRLLGSPLDTIIPSLNVQQNLPLGVPREVVIVNESTQEEHVSIYSCTPIYDGKASPEFFVFLLYDITEQRQLEHRLMQAQRLESVGHLAAGIAHEINTPIQYVRDNTLFVKRELENITNYIMGTTQFLNACQAEQKLKEQTGALVELFDSLDISFLMDELPQALDQTYEGAESVARIVKSIKEFSHPGSEEMQLTNLNNSLETTITVCKNEWKHVAEIDLQLDQDLPPTLCDPGEINQVILNIIVNAAHAIEEKQSITGHFLGKISISTRQEAGWVVLDIEDNGCGIPDELQKKVYDPFFTTKQVGKGTGQGLAMAFTSITKRHHGLIHLESKKNEGTKFTIQLPVDMSEA